MPVFLSPFTRDETKGDYDSCRMYDLNDYPGRISRNFERALEARKGYNLGIVSCEQPEIPEQESWQYDQSEGIKSIVNDVSGAA